MKPMQLQDQFQKYTIKDPQQVRDECQNAWNKIGKAFTDQVEDLQNKVQSVMEDVTKVVIHKEEDLLKGSTHSETSVEISLGNDESYRLHLVASHMAAPAKISRRVSLDTTEEGCTEIWLRSVTGSCRNSDQDIRLQQYMPEKLSLKLLRGKNLLGGRTTKANGKPPQLWIGLQATAGEELVAKKIKEEDPIWGGAVNTIELLAIRHQDQLVFWLEGEDKKRVPVSSMLGQGNRWLTIGKEARIQIRLSPAPQSAQLHPGETCPVLTKGPNLLDSMNSYTMRKQILYSAGAPVLLNIYDVSNSPKVAQANQLLKGIGAGGIFHAAVEVHGKEYSFGGTRDMRFQGTGVFAEVPKKCPMHHYRETVYLGDCELSERDVAGIIQSLEPEWKANSYNLFRKNCCFFCQELAIQLGVGDLPEWVYSLANTAEPLEPTLIQLNRFLVERTKAANNQQQEQQKQPTIAPSKRNLSIHNQTTPPTATEEAEAHEVLLDPAVGVQLQTSFHQKQNSGRGHGSTAREMAGEPEAHEVTLDPARAVRLQNSFRRKQSPGRGHSVVKH